MEDFLKAVDEVTLKDIASISQKLISSPLTMASYGDGNLIYLFLKKNYDFLCLVLCNIVSLCFAVLYVPSYESVSSKFRSK